MSPSAFYDNEWRRQNWIQIWAFAAWKTGQKTQGIEVMSTCHGLWVTSTGWNWASKSENAALFCWVPNIPLCLGPELDCCAPETRSEFPQDTAKGSATRNCSLKFVRSNLTYSRIFQLNLIVHCLVSELPRILLWSTAMLIWLKLPDGL